MPDNNSHFHAQRMSYRSATEADGGGLVAEASVLSLAVAAEVLHNSEGRLVAQASVGVLRVSGVLL